MNKIEKFARILSLIENDSELKLDDVELKSVVKWMLRIASETSNYHTTTQYRSEKAKKIIVDAGVKSAAGYHAFCSRSLHHEHVVPVEVAYQIVTGKKKPLTLTEKNGVSLFQEILEKYTQRATITKEERDKLDSIYRQDMPDSFWQNGDAMERFLVVKDGDRPIQSNLEKRTTDSWINETLWET